MSQKKIHFALVGCGRISTKHADAITRELKAHAKLVAVCDADGERASATGKAYKVPSYTDYHRMMKEHPEIDVVNVLTPSGDHATHVIDLSTYGKHIVVEKPMALGLADAEAMIRACDRAGVHLFVVKQNRYNLAVAQLKDALRADRLGKPVLGTVRVRWCRRQSYYDQDSWRGTWAKDGGVLANQASHHIDLLTWMLGDVESVFAYGATRLVNIETEDTAVAVLRFTSGALGIIEATTATRPTDLEGSLSVLGENASVVVGGFAVNELQTWNFADEEGSPKKKKVAEKPPNVYGFGHIAFLEGVIKSIRTGKMSAVDGLEGMKSLMLINAMYESMATGKEVRVFYRPRHLRLGQPA